jgi:hypothetical protein
VTAQPLAPVIPSSRASAARRHARSAAARPLPLARAETAPQPPEDVVYRNGQPLTYHWIRYTTLTWVERNFGMAVAHAYAGHLDAPATRARARSR